jgi:hypothetical protein
MVEEMTPRFWLMQKFERQGHVMTSHEHYEQITCPERKDHVRGGKRHGTVSVKGTPSVMKTDFVWAWGLDVLVSQRVVDIFAKHRVTGFEVKPAKVSYDRKSQGPPPTLFELKVIGWGGLAASAAGPRLRYWCPYCGHKVYTIADPSRLIDPTRWDGSDLFFVWPWPAFRFVSDRLADILRQEQISGVKLIPASEFPRARGAAAGPGDLRNHMPEERARQLEEQYGVSRWLIGRFGYLRWLFGAYRNSRPDPLP